MHILRLARFSAPVPWGPEALRRVLAFFVVPTLLGGCGTGGNNPASSSAPIADRADAIVTFDGARHTCVVALRNEAQGSAIPCSDVVPFLRDELRVPSGSSYDLRTAGGEDEVEMTRTERALKAAGYRFVGEPF